MTPTTEQLDCRSQPWCSYQYNNINQLLVCANVVEVGHVPAEILPWRCMVARFVEVAAGSCEDRAHHLGGRPPLEATSRTAGLASFSKRMGRRRPTAHLMLAAMLTNTVGHVAVQPPQTPLLQSPGHRRWAGAVRQHITGQDPGDVLDPIQRLNM